MQKAHSVIQKQQRAPSILGNNSERQAENKESLNSTSRKLTKTYYEVEVTDKKTREI